MRSLLICLLLAVIPTRTLFSGGGSTSGCGCSAPPPASSCCPRATRRRLVNRRVKRDIEGREQLESGQLERLQTPHCSSKDIQEALELGMTGDPARYRESIYAELYRRALDHLNIVCSPQPFFFKTDTSDYCSYQNTTTNETCYVFDL